MTMIERCDRFHRKEIKRARSELEAASLQALRFLAALSAEPKPTIGAEGPWRLVLLRVVNCVDLGAPRTARRILAQALLNSQHEQ
jgi:hypothetical protein